MPDDPVRCDDDNATRVVDLEEVTVTDPFLLAPQESREFPFEIVVPDETPLTTSHTWVWLETTVGIPRALDPTDFDDLEVLPHPHAQVVLDAIEHLGFRLLREECEENERFRLRYAHYPFIQKFEFVPTGRFQDQLSELELALFRHANGIDLWLEVDRRVSGLSGLVEEALDTNESRLLTQLSPEQLALGPQGVADYLAGIIQQHVR
jgi:sporulation-control protein